MSTRNALAWLGMVFLAPVVAGCVTSTTSSFAPVADQLAVVRDGIPALESHKANSVVLVRRAQRERGATERPMYVVAILNTSKAPINFAFSGISVKGIATGGHLAALKTWSYDDLVREEKQNQIATALIVGLAGAANSISAANAGYYSGYGTVSGPYGTRSVSYSGYSSAAASIAQANASMQNAAMINTAVEQGKANLANLEGSVLKDSTVYPGEWYGGTVQFDAPQGGWPRSFTLTVTVGSDVHEVTVNEALQKS